MERMVWNHTAFKRRIRRYSKFFRCLAREEYENQNKKQNIMKHFVGPSSMINLVRKLLEGL